MNKIFILFFSILLETKAQGILLNVYSGININQSQLIKYSDYLIFPLVSGGPPKVYYKINPVYGLSGTYLYHRKNTILGLEFGYNHAYVNTKIGFENYPTLAFREKYKSVSKNQVYSLNGLHCRLSIGSHSKSKIMFMPFIGLKYFKVHDHKPPLPFDGSIQISTTLNEHSNKKMYYSVEIVNKADHLFKLNAGSIMKYKISNRIYIHLAAAMELGTKSIINSRVSLLIPENKKPITGIISTKGDGITIETGLSYLIWDKYKKSE